jgi:ATP-binding cassette subfamily B protein
VVRDEAAAWHELGDFTGVRHAEGVGVDAFHLLGDEPVALRFSSRHKKAMHRFGRRVEREIEHLRNPTDHGAAWLDRAELAAAAQDVADEEKPQDKRVLLRLLDVAKPYIGQVWLAAGLTLISAGAQVFSSFLTQPIIDRAINPQTAGHLEYGQRVSNLIFWGGLYAAAIGVMLVTYWLRMRAICYVGSRIAGDLRDQVYSHLHTLSMRYFGKHRTGSLITRVTSDTDRLWDFVAFGSVEMLKVGVFFVGAAGFMLYANWRLALIAMAPLPLVFALAWWKTQVMIRLFGRLWTYWSRLTAIVGDALPGTKVIKAFAAEDREVRRFTERNANFVDDEYRVVRAWADMQPLVEGAMMLSRVLILIVGGIFVIRSGGTGQDTLGTLVMFLAIMGFFHMAIMEVVQKQRMVTRAATSAQRVFEVLDTPAEIVSKPNAIVPESIEGRVEFSDVSFSYDGAKPALRNVSLTVEPGQMIGLCGHSGAGKSTFVNLVSRFYDVGDGAILLDGTDIRDLDLAWLRGHVGVVLQEPYLF